MRQETKWKVIAAMGLAWSAGASPLHAATPTGELVPQRPTEEQSPLLGTVNIIATGPHGSYRPVNFTTGLPTVQGSIAYSGFISGDTVDILLKFTNGATDPFSANTAAILAYLQSLDATDTITSAIPANVAAALPGYDVLVTFTAGPSDPFLDFNFSSFAGGTLEMAEVGFVPEPVGLGVVALAGLGLLSRPKRQLS